MSDWVDYWVAAWFLFIIIGWIWITLDSIQFVY
jgi:hypothetical protein